VIEAILDAPGVAVMLGPVDVGKTTTATAIADAAVRARRRTVVVDADIGQSEIGPPATVGLAVPRRPVQRMEQLPAAAAFFVGDTTPQGVYRFVVEGTVRSVEWARTRQAEIVVVDTTGWVEAPAAVAAKVHKLRRIAPRHVIALQRHGEVEPILARLPRGIIVHRLRPSPRVRRRSREARWNIRAVRFRRYFARARHHVLDLTALPAGRLAFHEGREVPQSRMLRDIPLPALRHLLVGLADREGWLRAVGSVVDMAPALQTVTVAAPLRTLAGVSTLQWGIIRVAPSGLEEGRLR
jgi:polynucleotide 5'-hydroxyl-kinase GRC3/NOL9